MAFESPFEEADQRIAICRERRSETLYLHVDKIDYLPPAIASLTWLRELNLQGSSLSDLDVLTPLVNLEDFRAGSLSSSSPRLDFLKNCQSLRRLDLIATTPLDLAPLAACVHLDRLKIWCTQHPVEILNLERLGDLRSLTHLSLYNMRSDHFATVGEWSELTFVQLIETNLDSLVGFGRLRNLDHLDIHAAPVSDLSPLTDLRRLRTLDVSKTAISDLAPLANISSLAELNVSSTQVADFQPLAHLDLRSLDLSGCPVRDLNSFSGCAKLQRVDLSDTQVTSVESLQGLGELQSLRLARTKIRSLGPEGAFSRLGFLDATESDLDGLAALAPAHSLQGINITKTQVADLSPLRDAKDCRSLNLRGSMVDDLSPLIETGSIERDHRYTPQELDFRDTPAARASDRLAELAALAESDKHKCFMESKEYLRAQTVGPRAKIASFFRKLMG